MPPGDVLAGFEHLATMMNLGFPFLAPVAPGAPGHEHAEEPDDRNREAHGEATAWAGHAGPHARDGLSPRVGRATACSSARYLSTAFASISTPAGVMS